MDQKTLEAIEKVIKTSPCPFGCRCYKTGPENLCKARRTGLDMLLECLEDEPGDCSFSFPFGGSYYCKCGTRMEIAKLLG